MPPAQGPRLVGFRNEGNSCYANAGLQVGRLRRAAALAPAAAVRRPAERPARRRHAAAAAPQLLLGLPAFTRDLRAAAQALQLPPAGVAVALLQLAEQRERQQAAALPEAMETLALRRALGRK
jgi:hypothetical protein